MLVPKEMAGFFHLGSMISLENAEVLVGTSKTLLSQTLNLYITIHLLQHWCLLQLFLLWHHAVGYDFCWPMELVCLWGTDVSASDSLLSFSLHITAGYSGTSDRLRCCFLSDFFTCSKWWNIWYQFWIWEVFSLHFLSFYSAISFST